jgi:hypothetical protein
MNCLSERQVEIFLANPKSLKNLRIQKHLKTCLQCQGKRDSIMANLELQKEINSYLNQTPHE